MSFRDLAGCTRTEASGFSIASPYLRTLVDATLTWMGSIEGSVGISWLSYAGRGLPHKDPAGRTARQGLFTKFRGKNTKKNASNFGKRPLPTPHANFLNNGPDTILTHDLAIGHPLTSTAHSHQSRCPRRHTHHSRSLPCHDPPWTLAEPPTRGFSCCCCCCCFRAGVVGFPHPTARFGARSIATLVSAIGRALTDAGVITKHAKAGDIQRTVCVEILAPRGIEKRLRILAYLDHIIAVVSEINPVREVQDLLRRLARLRRTCGYRPWLTQVFRPGIGVTECQAEEDDIHPVFLLVVRTHDESVVLGQLAAHQRAVVITSKGTPAGEPPIVGLASCRLGCPKTEEKPAMSRFQRTNVVTRDSRI